MATITYQDDHRGGYEIRFQYDPDLVSLMKTMIPSAGRSWDPTNKCWHIKQYYLARLKQNTPLHTWINLEPEPEPEPPPRTSNKPPTTLQQAFVNLFEALTPTMRKPVKQALLKAVHPDTGGDHETAVALNAALETTTV